jgi:hypothetical protein
MKKSFSELPSLPHETINFSPDPDIILSEQDACPGKSGCNRL